MIVLSIINFIVFLCRFSGVKYSLFDEYLVHDIRYLFLSTIFIVLCAWIYTGCGFVTVLTITAIFFSLMNAYFIYTFILRLQFFPFMNILAVIVSLGKYNTSFLEIMYFSMRAIFRIISFL